MIDRIFLLSKIPWKKFKLYHWDVHK